VKVKNYMSPQVLSIGQETSFIEAMEKMEQHQIRHLLVMDGRNLAGIITLTDLYRVSPSPATALSNFELLYLLDKLTVKQIMTKKLVLIDPDETIKTAAGKMLANNISCLPVVKEGKLAGILTETDVLRAMMDAAI